ncbi:MAG TPA: glycoside hydrolase family 44 protein, partial [Ktedonobacteraceae bacterium]|nr:glycoside hydrolase family 44 protein [Ktedonobacteraceae bacterium]
DPARNLPNGSASDQFVEQNGRTGTKSLVTMPLIGWTAKATSPTSHPYDCGFKVSKYGPQNSTDQWDPDCGSGVLSNGITNIIGNDPADTSTAIDPSFVISWINHLKQNYGTAAGGGVAYYALDNEPMLWNSTHRDVHPNPTTYDELRDRAYLYSPAIKAADPTAKTFGPVLWGWCAYLTSAADQCSQGSDFQEHGNTWFVAWYLQQMHAYEQQHGQRILDYLDLHYYPQANGVSLSTAGGSATRALRLRSTRDLWDLTYTAESWIPDSVHLIPRMHDWVNANYPNTKLAITEYNWGGLEDINGALAQADVLGIFGREGLDLATLWAPPTSSQPGAFAFRIYRNYDGAGHGFGDVSISAASTDQDKLAVYAGQRGSDCSLTVVAINKTPSDMNSSVGLSGFTPSSPAGVYQYSSSNLQAISEIADQAVIDGGFNATFPANSITLFVISPASSGDVLRINGSSTQIASIWDAYQSVSSSDTNAIEVTACQQNTIDFNLTPAKNIILKGGYNCAFDEPPISYTTISGTMTISSGSVVVDRIIIM